MLTDGASAADLIAPLRGGGPTAARSGAAPSGPVQPLLGALRRLAGVRA